jgi:hypothetical protein
MSAMDAKSHGWSPVDSPRGCYVSRREQRLLRIDVVGAPNAASDHAVQRFLELFLERERPGTTWRVTRDPLVASDM